MLNLGARNKAEFISQIFTGRRLSAKLTEGLLLQISSCNLHLQSSHHLRWSPLLYTRRAFAQMQDLAKSTLVILSEVALATKSKDLARRRSDEIGFKAKQYGLRPRFFDSTPFRSE